MISTALFGYVGPGPGLTMVWAFFALLGTIGLAILSVLLWPLRMLIRRVRGTSAKQQGNADLIAMDGGDATPPSDNEPSDNEPSDREPSDREPSSATVVAETPPAMSSTHLQ